MPFLYRAGSQRQSFSTLRYHCLLPSPSRSITAHVCAKDFVLAVRHTTKELFHREQQPDRATCARRFLCRHVVLYRDSAITINPYCYLRERSRGRSLHNSTRRGVKDSSVRGTNERVSPRIIIDIDPYVGTCSFKSGERPCREVHQQAVFLVCWIGKSHGGVLGLVCGTCDLPIRRFLASSAHLLPSATSHWDICALRRSGLQGCVRHLRRIPVSHHQ